MHNERIESASIARPTRKGATLFPVTHSRRYAPMKAGVAIVISAWTSFVSAENQCPAVGEPIQWIADYCMLKMETDDEIAVSGCIDEESKAQFSSACASNTHFKKLMCELMLSNGIRTGTSDQCVKDPKIKGRTVAAGGVGS